MLLHASTKLINSRQITISRMRNQQIATLHFTTKQPYLQNLVTFA